MNICRRRWSSKVILGVLSLSLLATVVGGCETPSVSSTKNTIVVTYQVLGSLVKELVDGKADVVVSIPNGIDPHEWEPSAKDIETINKADLVIENGLGLEGGMGKTLRAARETGVKFFTASDHIDVRYVGPDEGVGSGDSNQSNGAADPHLWTDPVAMKAIVKDLTLALMDRLGVDVSAEALGIEQQLDALNSEIAANLASIAEADRKLVTGHESMGYFGRRYGFKVVGVIVPSLSSQSGVSAADLAALKKTIEESQAKVIFSELGTPTAVAEAIGAETSARVVELNTHALPVDGSYFTFMRDLADVVASALK